MSLWQILIQNDENRVEVMLAITDFVKRFEEKTQKVFISMVTSVLVKSYLIGLFSQFVIQNPSSINHHAPLSRPLSDDIKKCHLRWSVNEAN